MKRAFRVKRKYPKILRNRKARIARRLAPRNWCAQEEPMLQGGNLHYEMAERTGAVGCGGVGVIHTLVQRLGLVPEIDEHLHLLKVHLPYHESDHVLNFAYNSHFGDKFGAVGVTDSPALRPSLARRRVPG